MSSYDRVGRLAQCFIGPTIMGQPAAVDQDLQNQATMLYLVDHKRKINRFFPGPEPVV
jgi:hypothetical protein